MVVEIDVQNLDVQLVLELKVINVLYMEVAQDVLNLNV